jgi:hypothetical protein
MLSLGEWCFEFEVSDSEPIPRSFADDVISVAAIRSAESQDLGIGGGHRPLSPEVNSAALVWQFEFGLCCQAEGQRISELQATELRDCLQAWCESRGMTFSGGFRPFTPAETAE